MTRYNTPKSALLTVAAAALTGLSGCSSFDNRPVMPTHTMNPVQISETVERLELYSRPNGLVLSARDASAVTAFVSDYAARGMGPIYINRPSFGGAGVAQTDLALNEAMRRVGVMPSSVQSGQYQARPGDPAPVVVSYRVLRTVPQDCRVTGDLTRTGRNGVSSNFGCFASANLAAMIQDPRQLIEPFTPDAPNAQRRQVIYDRYIQGQTTAAETPQGQKQNSQSSGG